MDEKICKFCNLPFVPRSNHQIYCKRPHYMKCPVCRKDYLVTNNENLKRPPVACSYTCRIKRTQETSMKKYGIKSPGNTPEALKKKRETSIKRFRYPYATQSQEIKNKLKATNLAKYGVENPMQNEEIRKKAEQTNIEKYGSKTYLTSEKGKDEYKRIMKEKYGSEYPMQSAELKKKISNTIKEKYGEDWYIQSEEGKKKIHEAVKTKYGVDHVTQSQIVKDKVKEAFMKTYGVDNCSKSEIIKERIKQAIINKYGVKGVLDVPEIREKIIKTTMERYGVPFYIMKPEVKKSSGCISKFNLRFADKLKERGIDFEMEYRIENKSFDFFINERNLLLELNPTYTHNMIGNHWDKTGKSANYHKERCNTAFDNKKSIRCLFDWDIENELLAELTAEKTKVEVKDCVVYKTNKKTGVEFLSRCGRSRSKHYPKKIMIMSLVKGADIIAAIAVGMNKNVCYSKYEFTIVDYGVEWGVECQLAFQCILKELRRILDCENFLLEVDADRLFIEDIDMLKLKQLEWTAPRLYWSKKNIRIPVQSRCKNKEVLLDEGWLPVEDCGRLIFECS